MSENTYAGESVQKKMARAGAYATAAMELKGSSAAGGVVCLAGYGAHDIGPIRHFFPDLAEDRVLFVDTDGSGLAVARERMPGCHTFQGGLHRARIPWPVMLGVLDFTGVVDGPNLDGARNVLRRLVRGGIVLVTSTNGREPNGTYAFLQKFGGPEWVAWCKSLERSRGEVIGKGIARIRATTFALNACLGLMAYEPDKFPESPRQLVLQRAAEIRYARLIRSTDGHRRGQAMRLACYVLETHLASWQKRMVRAPRAAQIPRGAGPREMLAMMKRIGWRPEAFDLSPRNIAAYAANVTRGTYGSATEAP